MLISNIYFSKIRQFWNNVRVVKPCFKVFAHSYQLDVSIFILYNYFVSFDQWREG
jgi:hypothetical protein